jgi:hypothetical protein
MYRLKDAVLLILVGLAVSGLVACRPTPQATPTPTPPSIPTNIPVVIPTTLPPTPTPPPTATPIPAYGPTGFPANINPLTGLEVSDPNVLNRRPILIKVSNESEVVRPQSGLSFADQVWEYQMEGFAQTRFTAIIYSQSPERVGSVRSARLIDVEHLVDMYGGILVFSGGSSNLADPPGSPPRIRELVLRAPWADRAISEQYGDGPPLLVRIPDIPRPGVASWHTLFAVPAEIWNKANAEGFNQRPVLDGFRFDYTVPAGGTPTTEVVIDYPSYGPKHTWRYDAATGRWLSWTDDQPDGDTLTPGQQLAFDNVVIVYAEHYEADFLEDDNAKLYSVGVNLMGQGQAVLLRDGQRFEVTWRRSNPNSLIQFFDASGNVIAFKPGTTWFNVASSNIFPPTITFTP